MRTKIEAEKLVLAANDARRPTRGLKTAALRPVCLVLLLLCRRHRRRVCVCGCVRVRVRMCA